MSNFNIYCISARRPKNVPAMERFDIGLTWVLSPEDVDIYRAMGAGRVMEAFDSDGNNLVAARNAAIEDAQRQGKWCIQVSDDLRSLAWWDGDWKHPIGLHAAAEKMIFFAGQQERPVGLVGVSPTANTYFFRTDFSTKLFIVGDLIAISPDNPLRFDPALRLKEDYDFTCANLDKYGIALRVNRIMAEFRHRSNPGGAVSFREPAVEQEAIEYLKQKWPDVIRDNARRPNEVLIRWKG